MARILGQHAIEQFVHLWLSKFRNSSDIRRERRFIEKAIKQIQFFLDPPCCDNPDATIEYRRLDNDLTRFLAAQFSQGAFDRRKWRKSLERTIEALNHRLEGCCSGGGGLFTILWEEDEITQLGDNNRYLSSLVNIVVEPGVTYYFKANMTINTDRGFFQYFQWDILDDPSAALTWEFESSDPPGGTSTGYSYTGGSEGDHTLTISATVTNNTGGPLTIIASFLSHDSYFGSDGGNIIRTGSMIQYSTNPIP